MGIDKIRLEGQRALIMRCRLTELAQSSKCDAQIVVIDRDIAAKPDRLADQIDGSRMTATLIGEDPGVDPVKPDTQRVGTGCIREVIGIPIGSAGERCCSPPSSYRREQGLQRHPGSG